MCPRRQVSIMLKIDLVFYKKTLVFVGEKFFKMLV
jgi:hypothetical protein